MRRSLIVLCAVTIACAPAPAAASEASADRVEGSFDLLCIAKRALGCVTHYADRDGDGYGDPATKRESLVLPGGRVAVGGDCDDTDPTVHPGAIEAFNGRDDDCSGEPDDVLVVLSELMINPRAVPDADGEWIEVTNASEKPVHLDGVTIAVGSRQCALSGVLAANSHVVAARSLDEEANGGVPADVACTVTLPNTGGVVTIAASPGVLDVVDYRGWRVPDGASLSLDPSQTDPGANDAETAWCPATSPLPGSDRGTPGATNDICVIAGA